MSDTPQTDGLTGRQLICVTDVIEHARKLERELEEAKRLFREYINNVEIMEGTSFLYVNNGVLSDNDFIKIKDIIENNNE